MKFKWKILFSITFCISIALIISEGKIIFAEDTSPLTNRIQVLYNDTNGLPTSEANSVIQTRDGYIWIGGYGGLLRYDGNDFFNYSKHESGIGSSSIRTLLEDKNGRLLIGTNDLGVYIYEDGDFIKCNSSKKELFSSVRCFAADTNNTVYVGTNTGIAYIDEDNELIEVYIEELKNQTIYGLSVDKNGVLWGTTGAGQIFAIKGNELIYMFQTGVLSEFDNYSVLADNNYIYIGTSGNELIRLTLKDSCYNENSYTVDTYNIKSLNTINTIYKTIENEIWLGTNNGICWFDSNMNFNLLDGMEQNTFLSCITQDYEGNIWVSSTRGGVYLLIQGRFHNANRALELNDKSVNSVVKLDNFLYVATDAGLVIIDEKWNRVNNKITKMLEGIRIRHLFIDDKKNIWICSYGDSGLVKYTKSTGEILSINENDGLLSNKVRTVIQLKNKDIAVATMLGINIISDNKVIKSYAQNEGLDQPVALCLLEVSDGTILAGTDGQGIYTIKDDKVSKYQHDFNASVILRMREDKKAQGIWISGGNDLFFMNKYGNINKIDKFTFGIGSVFDMVVMEDDIWFMKSSGLIIVPREELLSDKELNAIEYGRESGLTTNITANSWSMYEDGMLYLCTTGGVYLFDNNNVKVNTVSPKNAINEIVIQLDNGETVTYNNLKEKIILPSNTQRMTIKLANLSFGAVPCTLEYALKGFDVQPILLKDQKYSISYTNLNGGDYEFTLKSKNSDGLISGNGVSIKIHKELTLFEYPIVWVCIIFVVIILVILINILNLQIKTKQLRIRHKEYREITDQALKTIANTIDAKDKYTNGHSYRVAIYSRELARRLNFSKDEQEKIYYIALLHDIGKIGIPDAILNKADKLTDEEFDIMKKHTTIGGDILKDFTALPKIGEGALSHHENCDGSGYPNKEYAETIPFVAKIIRVADSYDAMATNRSYRSAMDKEYIISEFLKYSGVQFEASIVKLIIEMINEGFNPEEINDLNC